MIKRMNVLIVPDEGGQSRRLNIPLFVLKFAAWLLFLVVMAVAAAIFSYSRFALKALDWNRLAAENERLLEENKRVIRAAREVAESREVLVEILRSYQKNRRALPDSLLELTSVGRPGQLSEEAVAILKGGVNVAQQFNQFGLPSLMPVRGFLSQGFTEDPLFPERSHLGIDIAGREGVPVVAAASGKVVFEGWTTHFGNCMILAHRDGYLTFYGHNRQNLRRLASEVRRGEPVALLGTTGYSSAPHLHFEIWRDGDPIDPLKMLLVK